MISFCPVKINCENIFVQRNSFRSNKSMIHSQRLSMESDGFFCLKNVSGMISSMPNVSVSSTLQIFVMNIICSNSIFAIFLISSHNLENLMSDFYVISDLCKISKQKNLLVNCIILHWTLHRLKCPQKISTIAVYELS